ncbi:ATP-dependent RecD-like DNA helicase [Microaerobacter geothermalis]|uniref:SF1B family DNA helicase RecD2 n=1 Tax=Microaerobacter geothermalis TaxID=674972 RepID=UPI001F3FFFEB|nr:ATP-dependent RecD-like DNA helicase [Microaerobacter geothermalis]MCF6094328.1 ATP-dependent RecD-like DNA helicase [Microaerobacter geothermalis]
MFTGKITKIIYRKEDFLIAKLEASDGDYVIKGSIYGVDSGETITVDGEWVTHPQYGKQLEVTRWERPLPKTKSQIIAFLASPLIKGCGEKRAKDIVQHLGEDSLNRIMKDGEGCLLPIKGIGQQKAAKIVESVRLTFEIQNILMRLLPYGITANMVVKAYKEFGSNTAEVILKNPYQLTNLKLIGFLKADEIAKRIGISPASGYRIEACVDYVLKEKCFNIGHCYLPEDELIADTLRVLNHNAKEQITRAEVEQGIAALEANERIVIEDGVIYPTFLYKHEKRVAQKLSKKLNGSGNGEAMPFLVEPAIRDYQRKNNMVLAEGQREAIRKLFTESLLILTGGPGTGKTTVIKAMIEIYRERFPKAEISLSAPTGRASRKLAELTGVDACTIHRLIGFRPGEDPVFDENNFLPCDLLIVDEVSMMDIQLADLLFSAVAPKTKVLLVGDSDQLPSVNPGNVLKDMLDAGVAHVKLTEIFRQAQESQIVMNAHRVNQGKMFAIDPEKNDFYFIHRESPEEIAETIRKSVLRFLQLGYTPSDILVLSPMKKGEIGTQELNRILQETINPPALYKEEIPAGKTIFRVGDKVIQTKNNYNKEVFNGDIGVINRIDTLLDEEGEPTNEKGLYCSFNGREVIYTKDDLKELQLAYSITVHKSQGGQAPVVIMPVSTSHYIMLARNLVYTGITRAEQKVVLIGTQKALSIAVSNNKIVERNTRLSNRLRKIMSLFEQQKAGVASELRKSL